MKLNERIIQLRKQQGLTQEQLGEALGVSRQAVSKWESGQANPDVVYVAEMCCLFHVSADWLLLGREPADSVSMEPPAPEPPETYCLYLHSNFDNTLPKLVEELFRQEWAVPAFPWEGGPITRDDAKGILEAVPMVLCGGMTKDEAIQAAQIFEICGSLVSVYRESDIVTDEEGNETPAGDSARAVPVPEKPMGAGMIFGLVVLGVIAAILILSIF